MSKPTPTTAATPRTINPAIAKLREEHKARVAELKANEKSAEILKRITEELLPKLTPEDAGRLYRRMDTVNKVMPSTQVA